jgi:hypothetical protein
VKFFFILAFILSINANASNIPVDEKLLSEEQLINSGIENAKQKLSAFIREHIYYTYIEIKFRENTNKMDHQYFILLGELQFYQNALFFVENST